MSRLNSKLIDRNRYNKKYPFVRAPKRFTYYGDGDLNMEAGTIYFDGQTNGYYDFEVPFSDSDYNVTLTARDLGGGVPSGLSFYVDNNKSTSSRLWVSTSQPFEGSIDFLAIKIINYGTSVGGSWSNSPWGVPNGYYVNGEYVPVPNGLWLNNQALPLNDDFVFVGGNVYPLSEYGVSGVQWNGFQGIEGQLAFSDGNGDIIASSTVVIDEDSKVVTIDGTIVPDDDVQYDLGSPEKRFANIYTGDLHLKNDRGHWQIIEESDFLTIINRKTNKRFKFVLEYLDDVDDNQ